MNFRQLQDNLTSQPFLLTLAISLSLGQLARWHVAPGVALYPHDILLATFLLYSWSRLDWIIPGWGRLLDRSFIFWTVLLVGIGNGIVVGSFGIVAILKTVRWVGYFLALVQINRTYSATSIWKYATLSGLAIAGLGLVQFLLVPDLRFLYQYGWDDHLYRLTSTILDPGFTGAILVITLFNLSQLSAHWSKKIIMAVVLLCLGLTFSRASYLSGLVLGLGLGIHHWLRSSNTAIPITKVVTLSLLALAAAGILMVTAAKLPGEGTNLLRTSTIIARWETASSWLAPYELADWLVGRGPFNSGEVNPTTTHASQPDNIFILLISTFGLLGMAAGGWMLRDVWLNLLKKPLPLLLMVSMLTHAQFSATLTHPFVLILMGLSLGWSWQYQASKNGMKL